MPFACLKAQHRMRPEISVMMGPIYDNLIDHESVLNFDTIKGINKNIFFVDHQFKEVKLCYIQLCLCLFACDGTSICYSKMAEGNSMNNDVTCKSPKEPKFQ